MKKMLLLTCFVPGILSAQDDSTATQQKLIKVISISGYMGGELFREGFSDRTVFQQATPNSTLAFASIAGYSNANGIFYYINSRASVNTGMNVNLRLRGQKSSELRVGIGHSTTSFAAQSYSKETTTALGTTTLPGGEVLYTDSVSYASYDYTWNADVINLNAAWILRSNPRNWVSVYTGFGIFGGLGFNGILEYSHVHNSRHHHYTGGSGPNYTTNFTTEVYTTERYRAPAFTSLGAYIPIGFNIRLGRRNNFFKHVALFGEYNGAVQFLAPKNVDSKTRTVSAMYGGIRWYVQAPGGGKSRQGRQRGPHHGYPD